MTTSPPEKYYISKKGTINIKCPYCSAVKPVSIDKLRTKSHLLKVKCTCSRVFPVMIEYRQYYRKTVHFLAEYINDTNTTREVKPGIVTDISLGGLALKVFNDPTIELLDTLKIIFRLDNKLRSEIKKRLTVVHIDHKKGVVGCEFEEMQNAGSQEKDLYYYLK